MNYNEEKFKLAYKNILDACDIGQIVNQYINIIISSNVDLNPEEVGHLNVINTQNKRMLADLNTLIEKSNKTEKLVGDAMMINTVYNSSNYDDISLIDVSKKTDSFSMNDFYTDGRNRNYKNNIKSTLIDVDDDRKQCYTATGYDYWLNSGEPMVWNSGSNQRQVSDIWSAQGSNFQHGIPTVTVDGVDRYLVATTETFGSTGDIINVNLENGETINCVIADAKSPKDSNWSIFGHLYENGKYVNVLEFQVKKAYFDEYGNPKSTNGYELPWDSSSKVISIENTGENIINIL